MPFREVEELIFSYRNLVKIDNLMGFESLTKLKLDCNCITKIENLSHLVCCWELWQNETHYTARHTLDAICCHLRPNQPSGTPTMKKCCPCRQLPQVVAACLTLHVVLQTNLTWLDLSFNQISKIEGLSTLQKLTDLSLLDNEIAELEGLDALSGLQCLSLGALSPPCHVLATSCLSINAC